MAPNIARTPTTNHYMFSRQSLGNVTDNEQSANTQEDFSRLAGALIAARLPSLNASTAEASRPYDIGPSFHQDLDLSILVSIRCAHETQRAKKSVRTQVQDDGTERSEQQVLTNNGGKEPSIRQKIFREMTQVLREDQDQRKNTGANRAATWKSSAPGGRDIIDTAALTGNSANAELAAGQRSLTVSGIWMLLPGGFVHYYSLRKGHQQATQVLCPIQCPESHRTS